jgi:hypothetical protein
MSYAENDLGVLKVMRWRQRADNKEQGSIVRTTKSKQEYFEG